MNELKDILLEQIRLHPAMGAGDLVKLIYQNEFGCGHLIDDPARALDRLKSELKMTPYEPEKPLFEPIGNDLMRLSLAAFPSCSLSEATLGAMFVYTANTVSGALPRFQEKLELLRGLVKSGEITCCTPDELEAYLKEREDALKRDHNKLGRELEYFTTVDCIGQGLPILLPKGARVIQLLQRWVEDTEQERGYLLTKTPLMAKRELYKISGHWDHYLDGMFIMGDPMD